MFISPWATKQSLNSICKPTPLHSKTKNVKCGALQEKSREQNQVTKIKVSYGEVTSLLQLIPDGRQLKPTPREGIGMQR